mgnify:FL=1
MPLWIEPAVVGGSINAPPSKSAMQRAVACATLAKGESVILNPSFCDDALAAMGVAEVLGARIQRHADQVTIRGIDVIRRKAGGEDAWAQALVASCGEAGLCLRMYSAIVALLPVPVELQAQGSLRSRPMDMVVDSLKAFGVRCSADGGLPPVRIHGPLKGGQGTVDGSKSSQFLTGLLIALACAEGDSAVDVMNLASKGYVDLTLDIMRHFGADVSRNEELTRFSVTGGKGYQGREYFVEGDWSGAAFLLVAGATAGGEACVPTGAATTSGLRVEGLSDRKSVV